MTNEQMEPHVEAVSSRLLRYLARTADVSPPVQFEKQILKEADEFGERVRSRRSSEASSRRSSRRSSRQPSRRPSRGSASGPNPLLAGQLGKQFGMSKIAVRLHRLSQIRTSELMT